MNAAAGRLGWGCAAAMVLMGGWCAFAAEAPVATRPASAPTTGPANPFAWVDYETKRNAKDMARRGMLAFTNPKLGNKVEEAHRTWAEFRAYLLQGRQRKALGLETTKMGVASAPHTPQWEMHDFLWRQKLISAENAILTHYGAESFEYAMWVNDMGEGYRARGDWGDFDLAIEKFDKAEAILTKALGGMPHPVQATVMANGGLARSSRFEFVEAARRLRAAMELYATTLGADSAKVALTMSNLSEVQRMRGDAAGARALLGRALEIIDRPREPGLTLELPVDRPRVRAVILNGLANIEFEVGDFHRARRALEQMLESVKAMEAVTNSPPGDLHALCLMQLAAVPLALGSGDAAELNLAEERAFEALKIHRGLYGEKHPNCAADLMIISRIYLQRADETRRDIPRGFEHMRQARDLYAAGGTQRGEYLTYLTLSTQLLSLGGDMAGSEGAAAERVALAKKLWGPSHAEVADALHDLAAVRHRRGDVRGAWEAASEAVELGRRNLELSFAAHSEQQQILMTRRLRGHLDFYLTASARAGRPEAERYRQVLAWKGIVFTRQRIVRASSAAGGERAAGLLADLRRDAGQLQSLVYLRATQGAEEALDRRIADLEARVTVSQQRLSMLAGTGAGDGAPEPQAMAEVVQAALPAGVALVDFLQYAHTPVSTKENPWPDAVSRFVAFVVKRDGIAAVEIPDAAAVGALVDRWRAGGRFDAAAGEAVRAAVWAGIEPHVAGAKVLLVSPDGALGAMPFGALPDGAGGRLLIERCAMASIPVPAVLALPAEARGVGRRSDGGGGALLVGGVNFDRANGDAGAVAGAVASVSPGGGLPAAQAGALRGPRDGSWVGLPGTAGEVAALAELFRESGFGAPAMLDGSDATKSALLSQAPGKRFIHLATHGFFARGGIRSVLGPADERVAGASGGDPLTLAGTAAASTRPVAAGAGASSRPAVSVGRSAIEAIVDPGLLSGICLAGANRRPRVGADGTVESDGGILTAAEVSRLDLAAVQAVVLSACESGLGEAAGGEGLLGLQRAFQIAGAQGVVASLWKVDDEQTRRLMTHFYRGMLKGERTPMVALRDAQLAILRGGRGGAAGAQRGTVDLLPAGVGPESLGAGSGAHPSLWAAWVFSGDPGDLARVVAEVERPVMVVEPVAATFIVTPGHSTTSARPGGWVVVGAAMAAFVGVLLYRNRRAA